MLLFFPGAFSYVGFGINNSLPQSWVYKLFVLTLVLMVKFGKNGHEKLAEKYTPLLIAGSKVILTSM